MIFLLGTLLPALNPTVAQESAGDTVSICGLEGTVTISRDEWGIPTISAESNHDLFLGFGFAMAQDRLWQMDGSRRLARGRIAEIAGMEQLHWDIYHRTLGLDRAARESLALIDPETLGLLNAFADGVNAYIDRNRDNLGFEFLIMQYEPEPWDVVDSLAIVRLVSVWLGADSWDEEMYGDLRNALGDEKAARFFRPAPLSEPDYRPSSPQGFVIDAPVSNTDILSEENGPLTDAPEITGDLLISGLLEPLAAMSSMGHLEASNIWAVDGMWTENGEPILAMDPHLNYFAPSILYEAHLHGGDFNCWGVTFPGMPFIPFGANEHLAWGTSNFPADCQDLFVETLNPQNPSQYRVDDGWEDFEIIHERIPYKDQVGISQIFLQDVYITRHGPVVNQEFGKYLAMQWTGTIPSDDVTPFARSMRASTLEEFYECFRNYHSPSQNMCVAETGPEGRVGQIITGHIPVRTGYPGTFPVDGADSDLQWTGYIPYDDLPHRLDPHEGFVAHANNIPRGALASESPYIGSSFSSNHRVNRIIELLYAAAPLDSIDMQYMQLDDLDTSGRVFIPLLMEAWERSGDDFQELSPYIGMLSGWDQCLSSDSIAASIYQLWLIKLVQSCIISAQPYSVRYYISFEDRWLPVLHDYLDGHAEPALLAGDDVDLRDQKVLAALRDAIRRLQNEVGQDQQQWAWGQLNRAIFPHPSGQAAIIGGGSHPFGGGRYTVRVGHYSLNSDLPFLNDFGAVFRTVISSVDGQWSIQAVLPPGEGGIAFGPHGTDQMDLWLSGQLRDVPFGQDFEIVSGCCLVPAENPSDSGSEEP